MKVAVPVTGRAALACPLTAPSVPLPRVVLGGVRAPFVPDCPLACAATPAEFEVDADVVVELVDVLLELVEVLVELVAHEPAEP